MARINTMYNIGEPSRGIAQAEKMLAHYKPRFGEEHPETALIRGTLAIGLARTGRPDDAMRAFRAAVPFLISGSRTSELDDAAAASAHERRVQAVVEAYLELLARTGAPEAATRSFRLAEAIRGRSVQAAVNASSVRWAARNPATAELIRKSQDLVSRSVLA